MPRPSSNVCRPIKIEDRAARDRRRPLPPRAEDIARAHAHKRERKGRDADDGDRRDDVDLQKREAQPHGKRIDARGDGEHEQLLHVELVRTSPGLILFILMEGVPQHLAADKCEQRKGDPGGNGRHVGGKLTAERPAQQRHEGLETAEEQRDDKRMAPVDALHAEPLADGDREGVHRQPNADQQQLHKSHASPSQAPYKTAPILPVLDTSSPVLCAK